MEPSLRNKDSDDEAHHRADGSNSAHHSIPGSYWVPKVRCASLRVTMEGDEGERPLESEGEDGPQLDEGDHKALLQRAWELAAIVQARILMACLLQIRIVVSISCAEKAI